MASSHLSFFADIFSFLTLTHAVTIKMDLSAMEVSSHHKLEKEEQPVAAEIKTELLDEDKSFPHNHLVGDTRC